MSARDRTRIRAAVAALLLVAGISALPLACGSARRGVPLVGPRETDDPEILLGRRVFDANCHQCHPGGTQGLGLALNNKPLPAWLIKAQVRAGIGAMPGFSEEEISDRELDALAEYLIWLRQRPD